MTIAVAQHLIDDDSMTAMLWDLINEEFLAVLDWDPDVAVLTFPANHPLLGWPVCGVSGCRKRRLDSSGLCPNCAYHWRKAGKPALEHFRLESRIYSRHMGVGPCAVAGCARPWSTGARGLCGVHYYQRVNTLKLPMNAFLAHPSVVGLPSFGPCEVVACYRDRTGKGPYCHSHQLRWRADRRRKPGVDEQHWRVTAPAVATTSEISLRGLKPRVVAEVLYCLQDRVGQGIKVNYQDWRPFCDQARSQQVDCLADLPVTGVSTIRRQLRNMSVKSLSLVGLNPETERHKDIWHAGAFGHSGTLRFTDISQPWLREATKHWAFGDVPRRRGDGVRNTVQARINSIAELSSSLRLQRSDHGDNPAALDRTDMTAFCNRLAYLAGQGTISQFKRLTHCRHVRQLLSEMRAAGLTQREMPMHGLNEGFTLSRADVPADAEDDDAGKDLPDEVMRHLVEHLPVLDQMGSSEIRVAVELLIDTGRRPDEICELPFDCLERDGQGKPVLAYDNNKANRLARKLPIAEATAAVIVAQQQAVRARFPGTPTSELKLLPTPHRNPHGRKAISDASLSKRHRDWVDRLPEVNVAAIVEQDGVRVTTMVPFDKVRIFAYAYRHSFAQRHADAGVRIDVLRDLMDHRRLDTTQRYYRVGEERRREAVERVTAMQFDRHGKRVWHKAKALLDAEHTRRAVGEVAVPYGRCSEPSNVAAGGNDCPVRFRCLGCGHFGTDVSYLPDLQTYLTDLLRSRERLRAATNIDAWAKREAMPSDEEIGRVRKLIGRIKSDVDELSDEDRAQVQDAVAVVRRGRAQITSLGLPSIRQSLTDTRPDQSA